MASTYVKVTSLEDALKYFDAGLLYWWSTVNADWFHQSIITDGDVPPTQRELNSEWWSILVEGEDSV